MRKDIQALRAIAVVSVVVYHLWPSILPGGFVGVDVFFVISGYLITSHLIKNPPRRPRDLAAFWARRILRLLPPVVIVVLGILAGALVFMSPGQWRAMADEAMTSMFYVENWKLIANATDYLAAQQAPSPFQHFWSLSVEEQYYIVWPFVVGTLSWISFRWVRSRAARTYALGFGLVVASSLTVSIVLTTRDPAVAYFSTYTRMWELAIGSLLASLAPVVASRLHRKVGVRVGILMVGLLGIMASVFLINARTPFPGVAAMAPTIATALAILANDPDHPLNPRAFSSSGPVQFVGDTSYALYLWHWPLITLAPYALGHPRGLRTSIVVLAVSIFMAWLSTRFLEGPVRGTAFLRNRPLRIYVLGATSSALVLVAALGLIGVTSRNEEKSRLLVAEQISSGSACFGAGAMDPKHHCPAFQPLLTSPELAKVDVSRAIRPPCLGWPPFSQIVTCTANPSPSPARRIALLGNSHAGHWLPAFEVLARKHGWQIDTYIVGVCTPMRAPTPFGSGMAGLTSGELTAKCEQVMSKALDSVARGHYDAVVMSVMDPDHTHVSDYEETLNSFVRAHEKVLVIRDTPAPGDPGNTPPDCVARNMGNFGACSGDPGLWIHADALSEAATAMGNQGVRLIGVNDYLCAKTCPVVIGGVIAYSDYNHLSATMATSLAPYIEQPLVGLLGR